MQIAFTFCGPYSNELVRDAGVLDTDLQGHDVVVVGKGNTRALAANDAVAEFANTCKAEYMQDVSDTINTSLSTRDLEVEADGVTHYVFCVLRFTE